MPPRWELAATYIPDKFWNVGVQSLNGRFELEFNKHFSKPRYAQAQDDGHYSPGEVRATRGLHHPRVGITRRYLVVWPIQRRQLRRQEQKRG